MVPEKYRNRKTPDKVAVPGFGDVYLRSLSVDEWIKAIEAINANTTGEERIRAISQALVAPSLVSEYMTREIPDCTVEEAGRIDQTLVAALWPHLCTLNRIEFGGKVPSLKDEDKSPDPVFVPEGAGETEKN